MKKNITSSVRKCIAGVLSMAVMAGSMAVPALAADNTQSDSLLTYQVADGLNLNDTTAFADSTTAWQYADKISSHVDTSVAAMRAIFAQRKVSIVDYGAQPHAVFDIVEGTYKKTDADAKAETELAKTNNKAI